MQKRNFLAAGVAIIVATVGLVGFGRSGQAQNVSLEVLSGQDLVQRDDLLLVDIRRPEEWQETGVVEGALLVTYSGAQSFLDAVMPSLKDGQKIALICRSGNRTSRAAQQIGQIVETAVIDVQGGMLRVVGEGYQPVKASREMGCTVC